MAQSLRFGHFEIRFEQRQLLVGGMPATLGSRAFDLLRALVERRERLVSKEELLELVWPGVIVEENNLQVQISALRKLLGTQVIATIPGRGYQFTAAPIDSSASAAPSASSASSATAATAATAATTSLVSVDGAPGAHAGPLAHATPGPRGHLLVAEDNKVNRLLLCRTLELMGHHVAGVDNGRKALEALRRERHDLLLLDLEMPELDGLAVLEELARDPELHDLPVIVTSSVEGVAQVARCIELGADDFLHKPVNPVLLRARVGSSLEKRRLREQQKALIQRLSAAVPTPHAAGALRAAEARRGNATVLAVRLRDVAPTEPGPGPAPDARDIIELLDSCHTLWRDAIASHGGVAFDAGSDALMAVFGRVAAGDPVGAAPPPSEVRLFATRAALEMAEMFDVLNAERAATGKPALALHIGVASGELVAGRAGAPPQALHCIGEPVRLALALQALAHANALTLIVDGSTQSALRGRIATEALAAPGPIGSDGKPVAAFVAADPLSRAGQSA